MIGNQGIVSTVLNLSESEFYSPNPDDLSKREWKLLETEFQGLVINAPNSIEVHKRHGLPVVLGTGRTTRRLWEVAEESNLVLLACDANTGTVYLGDAHAPTNKQPAIRPVSRRPPEPRETPPYAQMAGIEMLQARERLNLPWKSARLALVVISYDWVSNVVKVELTGEAKLEDGKLQAVKPAPARQGTGAGWNLPCYEALPLSPKPPQDGLDFLVRSDIATPGSSPIFGAFSIPARKRYIDRTGTVHSGMYGKSLPVVAVVPITLLVFALDCGIPVRFDWAAPVYGTEPVKEGSALKGYFALDLLQDEAIRLPLGTLMAYIVCDARIYGPHPFQI